MKSFEELLLSEEDLLELENTPINERMVHHEKVRIQRGLYKIRGCWNY